MDIRGGQLAAPPSQSPRTSIIYKTIASTLAALFAANAIVPTVMAATTTPQRPIELPPIVVKGERPKI
jgi:hypothetical protein